MLDAREAPWSVQGRIAAVDERAAEHRHRGFHTGLVRLLLRPFECIGDAGGVELLAGQHHQVGQAGDLDLHVSGSLKARLLKCGVEVGDVVAVGIVGRTVEDAAIASLDAIGMNMKVTRGGESFKIRLPFTEPARDRKAVKEVLVGMTKAAAKAAAEGKKE